MIKTDFKYHGQVRFYTDKPDKQGKWMPDKFLGDAIFTALRISKGELWLKIGTEKELEDKMWMQVIIGECE